MNSQLPELVPAIVAAVSKQGGYATKTKLLKLLYLWDVEFYRSFGRTWTALDWKFWHLGPWSGEVDGLITQLCKEGVLKVKTTAAHDTELLLSKADPDTDTFFPSIKEAAPLRNVLNLWAAAPTNEILDFVYFHTEPIQWGKRGKLLDFSTIRIEPLPRYSRNSSGVSKAQVENRRKAFFRRRESSGKETPVRFTLPRYDDEFAEAIAQLNAPER